jgi:hypothetical protein
MRDICEIKGKNASGILHRQLSKTALRNGLHAIIIYTNSCFICSWFNDIFNTSNYLTKCPIRGQIANNDLETKSRRLI